nr:YhfC family intramembrane metalloprotease [Lentilactobacillus parafarraginis]
MTGGKVNGVPPFAIGLMAIIGIAMVVIPIMTYWVLKPKYKLRASPVWVGAAIFFVAVIILEPILHAIVLRPTANGSIGLVVRHPYIYVAYGALAAGVFEETGRFIGFRYLKKRVSGFQTAIATGSVMVGLK